MARKTADYEADRQKLREFLTGFTTVDDQGKKKKSSLKQMIVKQEDRGFAKSQFIFEYNNVYLP